MKKLLILLTTTLLYCGMIWAQCPTGNIFLEQDDIDNFPTNYPNCTTLDGDVFIGDFVTNLSGLNQITTINGKLDLALFSQLVDFSGLENLEIIGGNLEAEVTQLNSFEGLESLTTIGGNFYVKDNSNLVGFSGLESLTSIGGEFFVVNNFSLLNLVGLEGITSIPSNLLIDTNDGLQNLNGLNNLSSVGGNFGIGNFSMTDISALSNLTSIGGNFNLASNSQLTNLSGLESLNTIGGNLEFLLNDQLTSLSGLENLTSIGGELKIRLHASLTSLAGIANIDHTTITNLIISGNGPGLSTCDVTSICNYLAAGGSATISGNATGCNTQAEVENLCMGAPVCPPGSVTISTQQQVDDFSINYPGCTVISGDLTIFEGFTDPIMNLNGLSQIEMVTGNLTFGDFLNIPTLTGLNNLTSVGGNLSLNNSRLTNLNGLENLSSIGGDLTCEFNYFLTDISGLQSLSSLGGDIFLWENSVLPNLVGLENLTVINGDFKILGNSSNTMEGLNNLTSIVGDLEIITNTGLMNMNGLENLTSIGGKLEIDALGLSSISGLQNLTSIGSHLIIKNTSSLTDLSGLENLNVIGGLLNISDNIGLTNLLAIDGLDHTSITYLIIEYNSNLSVCSVTSICNYLAAGGQSSILNNASGCNTQAEVEAICNDSCSATPLMSVNDQPMLDGIYQAADEVNSIGTVPVGGNVGFKAGQTILLDQNFTVEPNADFSGEIEDCGQ